MSSPPACLMQPLCTFQAPREVSLALLVLVTAPAVPSALQRSLACFPPDLQQASCITAPFRQYTMETMAIGGRLVGQNPRR